MLEFCLFSVRTVCSTMLLFRGLTSKSILIRTCQSHPATTARYSPASTSVTFKSFASTSSSFSVSWSNERTFFRISRIIRFSRILQSAFVKSSSRFLFCSALGFHKDGLRHVLFHPPILPNKIPIEKDKNVGFFQKLYRLFARIFQILKIIFRTLHMCLLVTPLILIAPLALKFERIQDFWFRLLVSSIQACGPVYVKLGQWASTRWRIMWSTIQLKS